MTSPSTPKRKRTSPTSTPPDLAPAGIDTSMTHYHGHLADDSAHHSPKNPSSAVAHRLSYLSLQSARTTEAQEQALHQGNHFYQESWHESGESGAKDGSNMHAPATGNCTAVLEGGKESTDYVMDLLPPEKQQQSVEAPSNSYESHSTNIRPHSDDDRPPTPHPNYRQQVLQPQLFQAHFVQPQLSQAQFLQPQLLHPTVSSHQRKRSSHSPPKHNIGPCRHAVTKRSAPYPSRPSSSNPSNAPESLTSTTLDPDDDGYGLNGIGYKPTPQVAYARAQKRKQQIWDWRAREATEARQRRKERRGVGDEKTYVAGGKVEFGMDDRGGMQIDGEEKPGRRMVRFVS